jgi:integrase
MIQSAISPSQMFESAIDLYLDMRRTVPMSPARDAGFRSAYGGGYIPMRNGRRRRAAFLAGNTENSYAQYADSLKLFFAGMPLEKIHLGHLRLYQEARLKGAEPFIRYRRPQDAKPRRVGDLELPPKGKTPCPVKPKKVNQELGLLQMLLKHAGAWTAELDEHYALLDEDEEDVPRALTPEEQEHWLHTAAASEETEIVMWYSLVAFETLNSTDEMRGYRIGDWNLQQRTAIVRKGKVRSRERTIQIASPDALWAMERLLERAARCGARDYTHYIFPLRGRGPHGEWDPGMPMTSSGIKRQWNLVRERSGLTWFRQYDPRHTGITRLAEEGVPIAVIKERAGHITDKMSRHYTHISEAAQRRWMEFAQQSRWARQQRPQLAQAQRFVAAHGPVYGPMLERKPPVRAAVAGATVLQAR